MSTTTKPNSIRQRAIKEVAWLLGLLLLGLILVPVIIYQVGQVVFGTYGGVGFSDFFGALNGKIRDGEIVAWFLILSPYFGWQCLRLIAFGWRWSGRHNASS